jgi:hypothetical protein
LYEGSQAEEAEYLQPYAESKKNSLEKIMPHVKVQQKKL